MTAKNKCSITIDNIHAAKEAVEHLIRLGRRKIGMVNESETAEVCTVRYNGYVLALELSEPWRFRNITLSIKKCLTNAGVSSIVIYS
ncbi:hypothetical protein ABFV83_19550 [Lacrimispora sp. BS-2]|uniref:Uncharacterized protein n=1 Tax=Lacrimispora sp. BS-2 TaxID=3151850 RepID=A0AAU7PP03_9FIRM